MIITADLHNPVKAIRAYCLECVCGSPKEVELCPAPDCPLYPFRFGKNPYRTKHVMSEEQKAKAVERLNAGRQKRSTES